MTLWNVDASDNSVRPNAMQNLKCSAQVQLHMSKIDASPS